MSREAGYGQRLIADNDAEVIRFFTMFALSTVAAATISLAEVPRCTAKGVEPRWKEGLLRLEHHVFN